MFDSLGNAHERPFSKQLRNVLNTRAAAMSSRSSGSAAQHCGAAGWGGGRDLAFRSSRSGARLQSPYALSVLLARLKTWNRNLYGGLYGTRCCCCISDQSYTNKRYSPPPHLRNTSTDFHKTLKLFQRSPKKQQKLRSDNLSDA